MNRTAFATIVAALLGLHVACGPGAPDGAGGSSSSSSSTSSSTSTSSSGEPCTYSSSVPLCPPLAHPCTMPGESGAYDPDCGFLAVTGLPGAAYCSKACGCPTCRMRGVEGQVCELLVKESCAPGLDCIAGDGGVEGVCEVSGGADGGMHL